MNITTQQVNEIQVFLIDGYYYAIVQTQLKYNINVQDATTMVDYAVEQQMREDILGLDKEE